MEQSIGGLKTMTGGVDTSAAYTLSPNDTLGQYRIIRPLGRGGMGEVRNEFGGLIVCPVLPLMGASHFCGDLDC